MGRPTKDKRGTNLTNKGNKLSTKKLRHTKKLSDKKLSTKPKNFQKSKTKEDMYKEVVAEGVIVDDKNATTLTDFHTHRAEAEAVAKELEEAGIKVQHKTQYAERVGTKMVKDHPIMVTDKVAFQESKIRLSRLPFWHLSCFCSMTRAERISFLDTYRDDLTENEIIANNLLDRVINGDKDAEKIFWDMQMKVLGKTNVVNQINVAVQKPDAIVTTLLDDIASRISAGKQDTPPTPQDL